MLVLYDVALAYCEWLSGEIQPRGSAADRGRWEKAARAGIEDSAIRGAMTSMLALQLPDGPVGQE